LVRFLSQVATCTIHEHITMKDASTAKRYTMTSYI